MSYIPNDVQVYTAAFTGCVGGMISERRITNGLSSSYSDIMRVADAWAQRVDSLWSGTPTLLDLDNIEEISQAEFSNRLPNPKDPESTVPGTYTIVAMAMLAAVQSASNQYGNEGITPPPFGQAALPITSGALTAMCESDVGGGEKNLFIGSNAVGDASATYKFLTWFFKDSMDFGVRGGLSTVRTDSQGIQVGNGKSFSIVQGQPVVNYQTGEGIFFFDEAGAVPTGNPATGVFLYIESSLLKLRGPAGLIESLGIAPTVTPVALAIDWAKGTGFEATLAAGANLITFANVRDNQTITVRLTGAASTVAWPGGTKWAGGTAPVQTASGVDIYTFIGIQGTVYGSVLQAFA